MGIATTYAQIPPLSELSGIAGMSGGPSYYDAAAAGQPSSYTYAAPWQPTPATDPWGLPPAGDPQNYGGMPPTMAVYPAGPVSLAAPVPAYPPYGGAQGAPFDARNYIPPESSAAAPPFDARNYVPPDEQQQQQHQMYSTYEPRTSESAFSNAMKLHGGGVISPVVPPASYLLSPLQSSSSGSSLYPQSPSGALSRSISAHPTEREAARLYDRPGTWRPRFQMPRSGVSSLLPNINRGKSFPPGTFRHFSTPPPIFVSLPFFLIYCEYIYNRCSFWCSDSRHDSTDFGRPDPFLRIPGTPGSLGPP